MLERALDREAFTEAYNQIVAAYRAYLPPGSKQNPSPYLQPEAFAACWAAECHRQFWRPKVIKLALIAESHVYTDADDLQAQIRPEMLPQEVAAAPVQFVRLIYCLGYGDNSILNRRPQQTNEQTDFWNIFAECAGNEPLPAYSLESKAQILTRLRDRGVWLCDASIHACMNPRFPWNKKKRDRRRNIECFPNLYRTAINASWRHVRRSLADAHMTWIIGKCVRDNLDDPTVDKTRWFYQPGAGLKAGAKKIQNEQLARFRRELAAL